MDQNKLKAISIKLDNLKDRCLDSSQVLNSQTDQINGINGNLKKLDKQNKISKNYLSSLTSTFNKLSKKINIVSNIEKEKLNTETDSYKYSIDNTHPTLDVIDAQIDSILEIAKNNSETVTIHNKLLDNTILDTEKQNDSINNNIKYINKII